MNNVEKAMNGGYPFKIRGNDGCVATLVDIQPLFGDNRRTAVHRISKSVKHA